MRRLDAASVDAIVTDPPYGLRFMGKEWDRGIPGAPFWTEALRVAKPGTYLLAMGGTRTYHRLASAVEDAGWEIRDCLMWLYGQGFPKGKWCLKPAWEPILLAKKKGKARLQIDRCLIGAEGGHKGAGAGAGARVFGDGLNGPRAPQIPGRGRWPANVVLDEAAAAALDKQTGKLGRSSGTEVAGNAHPHGIYGNREKEGRGQIGFGDSGGASRFFYCAKASRGEREAGLREAGQRYCMGNFPAEGPAKMGSTNVINRHPTVKPIALMRWLCRLVTAPGGLVLDPFCGSGTTGCAAVREGFSFLGIEKQEEYVTIAGARVEHWHWNTEPTLKRVSR